MKHRNYHLTTSGPKFAVIDTTPGHYQQVALCDTIEEAGEAINHYTANDHSERKTNDSKDSSLGI